MPRNYRLYLLDGGGHIRSAIVLDCPDDATAILQAERQGKFPAMELWERARKVKSWGAGALGR
jgi:hypothetical protein